ncbi:glycosyltransferase family 4 protein [Aquihabitans sp. G128]|uniref:glycosyltransferase family 4 protein n=1 Tax=Aquihabitans sp. G128 TaxID=2849779 RepID=UPI001C24E26C|nr:glycosyltransferase family 4 protein [Aquihabitans sp. G128]QXC60278.1 glycosyltransferase family 4 protein [Aquihabitans sp. G128]
MRARRQAVLGFVGIHAGRRTDQPVSQNETLALLFESVGYRVRRTSAVKHPILRTADQLLSLLWWRDVDVVIVAVFSGPSFRIAEFSSFLARHVRPKKVVLFMHGGNLPTFGPEHERRVRRTFDRADLLLAPSPFIADAFRPWGYDVRVIPNVLSIDRYRYDRRTAARPALLWMRTFHEHYHPELAIEVLARVAAVHPEATLTMGGADHGLLEATRARAEELGVLDRVRFAGYLDAAGKQAAFAAHDVFLNTNRVDNMPVSVLEAAASGLVPVATEVGGIPDLLTDGVDSVLVPGGDADAMAAAVLRLIDDPARYAALAAGARALAESCAWPAVGRRWRDELELLLPAVVIP